MKQSAAVLTEGPACEPSFAAVCRAVLAGELVLFDFAAWDPDQVPPEYVVPFFWVDSPEPHPLVLADFREGLLRVHAFEPNRLPRYARRRMKRRLQMLGNALFLLRNVPPDFELLPPDLAREMIAYAYDKAAPQRHLNG